MKYYKNMLAILLVVLIGLWLFGYLPTGGFIVPNPTFFTINGNDITLFNLLTLFVITWIIGIIPNPFRAIAMILLVLWIVSLLGLLPFVGISNYLVLAIIVGLAFYVIQGISHTSKYH